MLACRQAAAAVDRARRGRDRGPAAAPPRARRGRRACRRVVQAIVGTLLVSGHATCRVLAGLGVVYGLADGFVIPAQNGLIPAVVSAVRLQQANALLGLSGRSSASGRRRSAASSSQPAAPARAILSTPRASRSPPCSSRACGSRRATDVVEPEPFLRELREGWTRVPPAAWIFNTIVFFGIGNFAGQAWGVLAPLVVKEHYGGASTYGSSCSAVRRRPRRSAALIVLRWQPARPLLVSCVCARCRSGSARWMLAFLVPLPVLLAAQVVAGIGLAIHLALWFTVFQQQVPEAARSRVSSYDALGSFVLDPARHRGRRAGRRVRSASRRR